MIVSFGSKQTELIWNGVRVKNMPNEIQHIGRRKMRMLNNSQSINDLRIPPSIVLELTSSGELPLSGNKEWQAKLK
jgi:proteic killer suppression protein